MEPKLGGLTGIRSLHKEVSHLGKASHWAYIQLTKKKKKDKQGTGPGGGGGGGVMKKNKNK